jgi:hypothetical protein
MNELEYNFEVLEPELPDATVARPQLLVFHEDLNTIKVFVYFMENCAVNVTGGMARSAMGKVRLRYKADHQDDAVTACVNLRKILFTFTNAQGMASNFEFDGEST